MQNNHASDIDDENDNILTFKKNLIKLKSANCNAPMLTKADVIKCSSRANPKDIEQAELLIDKVWHNQYFNNIFTILVLKIIQGTV